MSVEIKSIKIGRCFVTRRGQVRKVINIEDGKVEYQTRGSKNVDLWNPGSTKAKRPTLEKFASDVDRAVRCDWDKDYPENTPIFDDET